MRTDRYTMNDIFQGTPDVERHGGKSSCLRDALAVGALVVFTNGPVIYLAWHVLHGTPHPEDPAVRAIFGWTAAISVLAVLLDTQRVSDRRLRRPPRWAAAAVVSFTIVIVASSVWSVDTGVTRARSLIYVGLAALSWIVADLEMTRLRRILLTVCVSVLAGSLLTVLISESIGQNSNGTWQGIFRSPAELAVVAALLLLVIAPVVLRARGGTLILWLMPAVLGVVVLAGTKSLTVLVTLLGAVIAASLLWAAAAASFGRNVRALRAMLPTALGALAALGTLATFGALAVLGSGAVWNSSPIASRRVIWEAVWDRIAERPVVGHGWFTFWNKPELALADDLSEVDNAHNSLLEVWLGAGLLALVPFVMILVLAIWGSARTLWRNPTADSLSWFAIVLFLVAMNVAMSFVLWFSFTWVLLMSAALRDHRPSDMPST